MGHSDKFKKVLMRLVEEMAAEGSGSDDDVRQKEETRNKK